MRWDSLGDESAWEVHFRAVPKNFDIFLLPVQKDKNFRRYRFDRILAIW